MYSCIHRLHQEEEKGLLYPRLCLAPREESPAGWVTLIDKLWGGSHRAGCWWKNSLSERMRYEWEAGNLLSCTAFFLPFFWWFVLETLSCPASFLSHKEVSVALLAIRQLRQRLMASWLHIAKWREGQAGVGKSWQLLKSFLEETANSWLPILTLLILNFLFFCLFVWIKLSFHFSLKKEKAWVWIRHTSFGKSAIMMLLKPIKRKALLIRGIQVLLPSTYSFYFADIHMLVALG